MTSSADLFRRNPAAYMLQLELATTGPLPVTVEDAMRITRLSRKAATLALRDLEDAGILAPEGRGRWNLPQPATAEPALDRRCRRCNQPVPPPRRDFCTDACKIQWHRRSLTARHAEERAEVIKVCVVCGASYPLAARAGHQLYCSTRCAKAAEKKAAIAGAVLNGTAGTCETCGGPTEPGRRWCSKACRYPG